jgi:hypothetical protein
MSEQITTAAELDALPIGSIARSGNGDLWRKVVTGSWANLEDSRRKTTHVLTTYDATVVFRPDRDLLAEARAEGAREAAGRIAEAARSIRNGQLDTWGYIPDTVGHILAGYAQAEGVARRGGAVTE